MSRENNNLHYLSDEEEVRRMEELRVKGRADQIARIELALEKRQLEIAQKLLGDGISLDVISESTGISVSKLSNGDVILYKTNMPRDEIKKMPAFPNQHKFYGEFNKKKRYQLEICLIIKA